MLKLPLLHFVTLFETWPGRRYCPTSLIPSFLVVALSVAKGLRGWVPMSYFGFESLTIWKYSWIIMNIHPFPDFEKIECFWCCMMLWSDALCGLFPSRKASVSTGWMPGGAPSKSESVSWSIWSRCVPGLSIRTHDNLWKHSLMSQTV